MEKASQLINLVRADARGISLEKLVGQPCPTCGRPAAAPYRRLHENGEAYEGCVDAHHTGHLTVGSASYRWHHREHAVAIRQAEAWHLRSLQSAAG